MTIAALDEYLLVDAGARVVDSYRRLGADESRTRRAQWLLTSYSTTGAVDIESLDVHIELDEIFAKLECLSA